MPSADNWDLFYIHLPIAVALIVAVATESMHGGIPNWLTGSTFLYLLAARILHEPWQTGWFLLSIFIAFVVAIGFGWMPGFVGAGVAKLAVAICAGLFPLTAALVTVLFVGLPFLIAAVIEKEQLKRVPGSVVLAVATAVTLGTPYLLASR
jgi:hypothetical protein